MSEDNVEVVRRSIRAYNRRDLETVWALNDRGQDEVNAHPTYRGIDAIRTRHQGWFGSYPDLNVEPLVDRAEALTAVGLEE
jgi:hypothetical protein